MDLLGPIPDAKLFAGQLLDPPWEGGQLYECRQCHLGFRHPIRAEADFERLYAAASEKIWVSDGLRADQSRVVERVISKLSTGSVLDVGCYDGTLLQALAPRLRKHGIELSTLAADLARKRGVDIVASRIADLDGLGLRFDAICAVDVIEHVANPGAFVDTLARLLAPGGWLFLSSGSLDSRAWRLAGGQYWYCGFPEHISFISRPWAELMAARTGLALRDVQSFAYAELPPLRQAVARIRYGFKIARMALQSRLAALIKVPQLGKPKRSLGQPGVFADHILLSYCKPEQTQT